MLADAIANAQYRLMSTQIRSVRVLRGGDTVAAINKFGIADRVGYISTAGGAFLEFLEGKVLPAVEVLEQKAN